MIQVDITGQTFGFLYVIRKVAHLKKAHSYLWECRCKCGKLTLKEGCNLRSGKSTRCNNCLYHGEASVNRSGLYTTWRNMYSRCYTTQTDGYEHYGGRGIKVCYEWKNDFIVFRDWAYTNGYIEGLTIDRIDVNGNYEPSNCRWMTNLDQQSNRRNTLFIEHQGKKQSLTQWARELGLSTSTIKSRYQQGWNAEDILRPPTKAHRQDTVRSDTFIVEINGESKTSKEWAEIVGVHHTQFLRRLKANLSPDQLLMPSRNKK
jgi:hypothetical protein